MLVTITSGDGATTTVMAPLAIREALHESCAWMTAVNAPKADGTPATTPVAGSSDTPGGSDPEAIDHTAAPTWPVATATAAYGMPT